MVADFWRTVDSRFTARGPNYVNEDH
jgi:hypothetical protein